MIRRPKQKNIEEKDLKNNRMELTNDPRKNLQQQRQTNTVNKSPRRICADMEKKTYKILVF